MTRDELLKKICPWGTCDCGNDYESCNCDDCNRVLEEWLYDYEKHVIDQYKANTEIKDTIREIHDNVAHEMYCKGIDDLRICKRLQSKWKRFLVEINMLADRRQLKEVELNEIISTIWWDFVNSKLETNFV